MAAAPHCPASEPYTPPVWVIDLSLPPRDRYRNLARHYKDLMQELTGLFDSLLHDVAIPDKWVPTVNKMSRLLLRKVNDNTQTEELRGISEESGVPMYLLVALNVILDLLMGCTSGGVRSLEKGQPFSQARMLHFRTLDWTMDPLRLVVVQLNFIRSKSLTPNMVLASSITYVGFVGVLTGVRQGLSMSLNFRGLHDNSSKTAQFRFYFHHLLVLFGRRPSIATLLRRYLTGDHETTELSLRRNSISKQNASQTARLYNPMDLASIYTYINAKHTTACYLIFSDGASTISIDKDFRTSTLRRSEDFIATTNHDVIEHGKDQKENAIAAQAVELAARHVAGIDEFLEESADRHECISNRWKRIVEREKRRIAKAGEDPAMEDVAKQTAVTQKQVIEWTSKYPTTNECTHFAAVMDPKEGKVAWCVVYPQPHE
ncbi:hypothetical protein H2198_007436 [Neophaeococcomyces mojaviensis]|uniref:Uncharacterized protein n=1 Tax=Neophaeococcomyces mojaviensis TaxID=3383035 RepID=A0ACC3A0D8_9EURO|nr:hypothetical protein H2198_007436 [Knufia sp. JES_112]